MRNKVIGLIAIDPGVTATGVSIWFGKMPKRIKKPDMLITIKPKSYKDWETKIETVCNEIEKITKFYTINNSVIELPEYYSSLKGVVSAASQGLVKLSIVTGVIWEILYRKGKNKPILIPAKKWKGQLKKPVMERRIRKILSLPACYDFPSDHVMDSTGLGLYQMGFMK